MGPIGLTLLFALSCSAPFRHEMAIGNGVTLEVYAPHGRISYPTPAEFRVTVRNRGDVPFTLAWPPSFRLHPDECTRAVQRNPVEVSFRGETLDRGFNATPYEWDWRPSSPPPIPLVVEPGQSHVLADVKFTPPKGAHMMTGRFCIRVYGYDMPGGVVYRGPGR